MIGMLDIHKTEQEKSNGRPLQLSGHMAHLDGIRGIAILGVIAFHLQIPGCETGWLGVPLFFVLSGFLITGILLDADRAGYFKTFYARRILRIFPIYYLLTVVVTVYCAVKRQPHSDWYWFFLYIQNYGYSFTGLDFPEMFKHTWSLAVEEQFYLIWPLIVFLSSRRALLVICTLFIGVAVATRLHFGSAPISLFGLPSNLDTLCGGAIIAILLRTNCRINSTCWTTVFMLSAVLLSIISIHDTEALHYSYVDKTNSHLSHILYTLVFATSIPCILLNNGSPSIGILRNSLLMHIGKISYGLYLFHFPIFYYIDRFLSEKIKVPISYSASCALKIAVVFLVAEVSWRFVESPINRLKTRFPYHKRAGARESPSNFGTGSPCVHDHGAGEN